MRPCKPLLWLTHFRVVLSAFHILWKQYGLDMDLHSHDLSLLALAAMTSTNNMLVRQPDKIVCLLP